MNDPMQEMVCDKCGGTAWYTTLAGEYCPDCDAYPLLETRAEYLAGVTADKEEGDHE